MHDQNIVAFVGRHNSGKTTLVIKVIDELVNMGFDVGAVKHHGHRGFEVDVEGKDSWRMKQAGAVETAVCSPDRIALVRDVKEEPNLGDVLALMAPHDIVIVEGYRHAHYPTIEVMRSTNDRDAVCGRAFVQYAGSDNYAAEMAKALGDDASKVPTIATIGVATDMQDVLDKANEVGIRAFHIDDASSIARFIANRIANSERNG